MLKRLISSLFLASSLWGYTSLTVHNGDTVKMVVPNVVQFSAEGDVRYEFRIHTITPPTSTTLLFQIGRIHLSMDSSGNITISFFGDTQSSRGSTATIPSAGVQDILIRAQRFGAAYGADQENATGLTRPGGTYVDAQDLTTGNWLTTTCAGINAGCPVDVAFPDNIVDLTGSNTFFQARNGAQFSLAYFKLFSTTVQPYSSNFPVPIQQMGNESIQADLADFRFESNYNDSGSGALGVTLSTSVGSPTYAASRVEIPACNITQQSFSFNAAATPALNAYTLDGGGTLTFAWSQLTGGTTLAISGSTTATPSITNAALGSYTIQLVCTDGTAHSNTVSFKYGFVDADSNDFVTSGNTQIDELLSAAGGRLIRLGANPMAWEEEANVALAQHHMAKANTQYSLNTVAPWDSPQAGHIVMTNGSSTVTGFGTSFQSTVCTGTTTNGGFLVVYYPWANSITGHGYRLAFISGCPSNTQLTISGTWNGGGYLPVTDNHLTCTTGAEASCWQFAYITGTTWNNLFSQNSPPQFYDVPAAFYALYYRSGIDDYLNYAHWFEDLYWRMRQDLGNNNYYGNGLNMQLLYTAQLGATLRAIECPACLMWPGIELAAQGNYQRPHDLIGLYGDWQQIGGVDDSDPRNMGYLLMMNAMCAEFDPNPTPAATCRTQTAFLMNHGWTPSRFADGNWYSIYWGGGGGGYGWAANSSWSSNTSVHLTNGSSTATCGDSTNGGGSALCAWAPPKPVITTSGTAGTTTYSYTLYDTTISSPIQSNTGKTSLGNATLSGSDFNIVTMSTVSGHTYSLCRGGAQISTFTAPAGSTVVNDTGLTAGAACSTTFQQFTLPNETSPQVWSLFTTPGTMPTSNATTFLVVYPSQTGPQSFQMQDLNGNPITFTGTTGNYGWMVGGSTQLVGYGVQPYMLGISATAMYYAYRALACTGTGVPTNCDSTASANAKAYTIQMANYLAAYSYDPIFGGAYYGAGFANCTPPIASNNFGCRDSDGLGAAREIIAEAQRGVMMAYSLNHDPALRTFGDLIVERQWGLPNYAQPSYAPAYDGNANNGYLRGWGSFLGNSFDATKYFGAPFGLGAAAAWPWIRAQQLNTPATIVGSLLHSIQVHF